MRNPIIDLHCDLLSYLESVPNADPFKTEDIGCSIPAMREGGVGFQVLAIFTATEKGSVDWALRQSEVFKNLLDQHAKDFILTKDIADLQTISDSSKIGVVASIENASGLCEEDQPLDGTFKNLERIISNTERVLYIGLTHHKENRFGGGNYSEAGLKDDGRALLDYINGRSIAIDFSHTSDALAYGILDHISKNNLDIPILASHSNYREVFSHPRNLPDELAKEVIQRGGLIGLNFVRAFLNDEDPNAIYDHIAHGLELGGIDSICFGADYFHTGSLPDPKREPYYHQGQETAVCYPSILEVLSKDLPDSTINKMSSGNATGFLQRIWR